MEELLAVAEELDPSWILERVDLHFGVRGRLEQLLERNEGAFQSDTSTLQKFKLFFSLLLS